MPTPKASRPEIPASYGVPKSAKGLLPWSYVTERMTGARNYWVATTRPDGRPHVVPVWGIWLDGTFFHGGGGDTRKARNLDLTPHVAVHLESGDHVVIMEGAAEKLTEENADQRLLARVDDAYEEKYGMRHGTPVWRLHPTRVLAWTEGLATATRWTFDE